MAEGTIDELSLGISADADSAIKSLDRLVASLDRLEAACSAVSSLARVQQSIASLNRELASPNLSRLSELAKLKDVKLSAATANNLERLVKATASIPADAGVRTASLAEALKPLSALQGVKVTAATVKRIQELPAALKEYEKLNIRGLTQQMGQLSAALTPLAASTHSFATAINLLPKSYRTAAASSRTMVSANKTLAASNEQVAKTSTSSAAMMARLYGRVAGISVVFMRVKNAAAGFVTESNTYIENMNLFAASMGSATEAATEFGMSAQNLLGIDFGEWARNQGVFQTLITGMGVASNKADVMSQQLTQLGYDIASFYNLSTSDAFVKLQSGIAGELEPLRRLGWDLSNARMNLELSKMGIDANAQSMTQAEKVALRYQMIMQQVTITHGDMARTIASPANQIRVLQAQVTLAARSIGNLLIPALNMILPAVIAAMKAVRLLAIELASFFGIDATFEVDYSSLDTSGIASGADDAADSFEDATDKAKELKNAVMGFDELNKLNDNSTGSSSGSDGAGIGLDLPIDTYDFFEGLTDKIGEETDRMAQRIVNGLKKALPIVALIGAGIAAWKLASFLDGLDRAHKALPLVNARVGQVAGGVLAVVGAAVLVGNAIDAWGDRIEATNLIGMFGGLALMVGGLALAFGPVAAAIGAVAGGLVIVATGMHDASKHGFNASNFAAIAGGAAVVGGAIGALVGGPIAVLVGALAGLAIAIASVFVPWDDLMGAFDDFVNSNEFQAKWMELTHIFEPVCEQWDALADVSEETAERFGTSLDSMTAAQRELAEDDFAEAVISDDDVDSMAEKIADVRDTILDNLDSKRNKDLAAIDLLEGVLPPERIAAMKQSVSDTFDDMAGAVQDNSSRINQIYAAAASEHRSLTDDEAREVKSIMSTMQSSLIESSGATETEIMKINRAMAHNSTAVATEAASEVIKQAIEVRDTEVNAAWDRYRAKMEAANMALEAGDITRDEYDTIKAAAEGTRDAEVQAANDAYYGDDGVLAKTQAAMGDAAKYVDAETGEIKSDWDLMCDGINRAWDDFTDGFNRGLNELTGNADKGGNAIGNFLSDPIGSIQRAWANVSGWFYNNVIGPIERYFAGMVNNIIAPLNTGLWAIETMMNSAIFALNRLHISIPSWVPLIGGRSIGFNIRAVSLPRIPYFADGGFPPDGELFIANEAGPEMVGKMGSRNVVANNKQIIEGIEAGVTKAMLQVVASTSANKEPAQTIEIPLVIGNEELARATYKGNVSLVRRGEIKANFA